MVDQDRHALDLLTNLRKMYEEEGCFLSDVTLVVGEDRLRAHRLILAAESNFFKGLFRNDHKTEVNIEACSFNTLKMIVNYFYTGISDISVDNVEDILMASDFLQVEELIQKCSDFMARNLDMTNCVTMLRLADFLNNDRLVQECVNFIGDNFQALMKGNAEMTQLSVDLFAKCIKSDRIILFSKHGTVLAAIQREEALVRIIVDYIKSQDKETRLKDTWPLFRALKLPFVAHHLDFRELGLPELADFNADPTVHSLISSCKVHKNEDLRRKYSPDPFTQHISKLRAFSVKYIIWSKGYGTGPNSSYRKVRPFSCEGGPDKFITNIDFFFRPWRSTILGGIKVSWSNGSTDVAGETDTSPGAHEGLEKYSVDLDEGENIQKINLKSGWFIDRLDVATNLGRKLGPWGGNGGASRKTQGMLRRNLIDPRYVYLDGIKGYVVKVEGRPALNRLSFKWAFFLGRKISKHSYYNSIVIKEDSEKISVAELESEINLTLTFDSDRRKHQARLFNVAALPVVVADDYEDIDDDDDEDEEYQVEGAIVEPEVPDWSEEDSHSSSDDSD